MSLRKVILYKMDEKKEGLPQCAGALACLVRSADDADETEASVLLPWLWETDRWAVL